MESICLQRETNMNGPSHMGEVMQNFSIDSQKDKFNFTFT